MRVEIEKSLSADELKVYNTLHKRLMSEGNFSSTASLMVLDLVVMDYLRIKRLHRFLHEHGDVHVQDDDRRKLTKYTANPAGYLLNSIGSQMRQNMRELLMTPREKMKQMIEDGTFDLADFLQPKEGKDGAHKVLHKDSAK